MFRAPDRLACHRLDLRQDAFALFPYEGCLPGLERSRRVAHFVQPVLDRFLARGIGPAADEHEHAHHPGGDGHEGQNDEDGDHHGRTSSCPWKRSGAS